MYPLNSTSFVIAPLVSQTARGRYQMTLIVKGTFQLVPAGMAQALGEQPPLDGDQPWGDDPEGGLRYSTDLVPMKPRADLLLAGKCHPPGGTATQCTVAFQVGDHKRSLRVCGDRQWLSLRGVASPPQPFTKMELRYENSFGGADYPLNPVGKGRATVTDAEGQTTWPLPNLEDPAQPFRSPNDRAAPAGFGPLGVDWQPRLGLAGTYDAKWQQTRWPCYPADFDGGYFNAASAAMQVEGYLRGDEQLYFENLHPRQAQYHCRLPGLRVRSFLVERSEEDDGAKHRFYETPMNLDTLWVDMEAEQLVLVWRGVAEVRSEDAAEIDYWYVLSEEVSQPTRSAVEYREMFARAVREIQEEEAVMGAEQARELNEQLRSVFGAEFAGYPENLAGQGLEEQIRAVLAVGEQVREQSELRVQSKLQEAGIDPAELDKVKTKIDTQRMRALGLDKQAWETVDKLEQAGLPTHEVRAQLFKAGIPRPSDSAGPPVTEENFLPRLAAGESFFAADLTDLDLTGADLRRADLRSCYLAGVSLAGADLTDADLSGALLAEADLSNAKLIRTRLTGADLGKARLPAADLTDAVLNNANFEGAELPCAVLQRAAASKAIFVEANLAGATLCQGMFQQADLSKATLTGANFREADLQQANLNGAAAERVDMTAARLAAIQCSDGCVLTGGVFHQAQAAGSIWLGADLRGADFSYAQLVQSFFLEASLEEANLTAADLRFARFGKANLTRAALRQANLFEADLIKADLTEADLRDANAFGAEFMDAVITDAQLDGMNAKMTKLAQR